jgi:c(7)-type cytochrome triheme protein
MKRAFLVILVVLMAAGTVTAQSGSKKKRPLPFEYGRVVLNNFAEKANFAPVAFDHWLHRSKFTCRLCHVDLAFAMKSGATGITAADNMSGYYCGTCHNGKMVVQGKTVFASCSKKFSADDISRCNRCHSVGKRVTPEYDFTKFTGRFPKERFGNGIDWEKAEHEGYVKPLQFLEGVSITRKPLSVQKDFALSPNLESMPGIIFSHTKHTVWNGCELCHPEIFVGVKRGQTKYSMVDIFEGKYCGVCHRTVAFPLIDCQRCHAAPVQWPRPN